MERGMVVRSAPLELGRWFVEIVLSGCSVACYLQE